MVDRHHPGKAPTALLQALAAGACLTIAQLEEALDLTRRQVSDAASCLLRRDYLMRMGAGCYQLTEAGIAAAAAGEEIKSGPRGPHFGVYQRRGTFRERCWRSMRMHRRFTVQEIVSDAGTEADKGPEDNLRRYLGLLASAGYVKELPRRTEGSAPTSNGFKRWMLARDTGPKAPVALSKVKGMRDLNTGEVVLCKARP